MHAAVAMTLTMDRSRVERKARVRLLWLLAGVVLGCAGPRKTIAEPKGDPSTQGLKGRTIGCPVGTSWPVRRDSDPAWTAIAFSTRSRPFFLRIPSPRGGVETVLEEFSARSGTPAVIRYPALATLNGVGLHVEVAHAAGLPSPLELNASALQAGTDRNAILAQHSVDASGVRTTKERVFVVLDSGARYFQKLKILHDCSTRALDEWSQQR
jgi:hypothetical protein